MNHSKSYSLLCVVEDPVISPSSRLRIFQHLDALNASGISVEVILQPKRGESWSPLLKKARTVDAVLWQKVLISQWDVLRLRRASKRLIFDLDDAVWMGKRNHVPYVSGKQARRFGFFMRFIDGAICGSPVLEAKINQVAPNVSTSLIPTSVPKLPMKECGAGRGDRGGTLSRAFLPSFPPSHREQPSAELQSVLFLGIHRVE